MDKNDLTKEMPYMSPLINREDASKQKGFTDDFHIESATEMLSNSTRKIYTPAQVRIVNHYRFEGMSDPGDNSILYEIETTDGTKGTLITPYGNDCPAHVADFLTSISAIKKQHSGTRISAGNPQDPRGAKLRWAVVLLLGAASLLVAYSQWRSRRRM